MLAPLLAAALLHAAPAFDDGSVDAEHKRLEAELDHALAERPSGLWFIGGGALLHGGAAIAAAGVVSGGFLSLCFFNCPTYDANRAYVLIGIGLTTAVIGLAWLVVTGLVRIGPNREINAIEERLRALLSGAQPTAP